MGMASVSQPSRVTGWRVFASAHLLKTLLMFAARQKTRYAVATPHCMRQIPWLTHITGARGSAGSLKSTRLRLPVQKALNLSAAAIGRGSQRPCGGSIPRLAPGQFI